MHLLAAQGVGESSQYGAQSIGEASFYGASLSPQAFPGAVASGVPISEVGATTVAATSSSTSADLMDARNQALKLTKVSEGYDERSEKDRVTLGYTLATLGIAFYLLGQLTHKYPLVVGSSSTLLLLPAAFLLFIGRSRLKSIERVRWLRVHGDLLPSRVVAIRELGAPGAGGQAEYSIRFEVTHPHRGPYDAMVRVFLPAADLPREGTRMSVRVNPTNPYELVISS